LILAGGGSPADIMTASLRLDAVLEPEPDRHWLTPMRRHRVGRQLYVDSQANEN